MCFPVTVAECGVPKIAPNAKSILDKDDLEPLANLGDPSRIVKGEDVIPNSWPWMAALINGNIGADSNRINKD